MSSDLATLRYVIIVASAALLLVALLPMRRLLSDLPEGVMRRAWSLLGALLLVMITAHLVFASGWLNGVSLAQELMVPTILFISSWFIMLVCQLSAGSVHDINRISLLERESITDALTGLYNRRHMDRVLGAEVERARRTRQDLSFLLIDIDHFKRVNDEFGHQVGDHALWQLSNMIQTQVRMNDTVARYGGEEIAVILPGTGLEQATWFAERMRSCVDAADIVAGNDGPARIIPLTVSVGVSQWCRTDGFQTTGIVQRADQALYRAKANGRNRVEMIPPPGSIRVEPKIA